MGHSRRVLCSRSRWQYSKAFSRSCSWGGSGRLVAEAADSTDVVEPSSSDLSSAGQDRVLSGMRPGRHPGHTAAVTPGSGPSVRLRFLPSRSGEGAQGGCLKELSWTAL